MDILSLSIVIPTYNELENIKIIIPQIENAFADIKHEILVVDDSSPDKTGTCALELNKQYGNIRLINREKKEGIGAALREGYNTAKGTVILSSDADLSFTVSDMRRLYEKINEGYDLVIGARHNIKGCYYEMNRPITKIKGMVSRIGNAALRSLASVDIHDFSANFRAIRKTAWQKIELKENTNVILFEMIIKAKYKGLKIIELPVSFKDRIYGKSKLNLSKEILKSVFKSIVYLVQYR